MFILCLLYDVLLTKNSTQFCMFLFLTTPVENLYENGIARQELAQIGKAEV